MVRTLSSSEEAIYTVLPIIQVALFDEQGLDHETALKWIQHILQKSLTNT